MLSYDTIVCIVRISLILLQVISFVGKLRIIQPLNHFRHLIIRVDPETLLLRNRRQLDVLEVEFLLHNLLKSLEDQRLCLL